MKFLKIGAAACIALLAMSFTIASHAGAFKGTSFNTPQQGCFLTITATHNPPQLGDIVTDVTLTTQRNPQLCSGTPVCCYDVEFISGHWKVNSIVLGNYSGLK